MEFDESWQQQGRPGTRRILVSVVLGFQPSYQRGLPAAVAGRGARSQSGAQLGLWSVGGGGIPGRRWRAELWIGRQIFSLGFSYKLVRVLQHIGTLAC